MKKILLVATSLFVLSANSASACSCLARTPKEYLDSSKAVFSGKAIDVVEQRSSNGEPSALKVSFAVTKVWKGDVEQRTIVTTANNSAACGISFQKGEEYLVYASSQQAELSTGLCSGTKPLSGAQADLAVLGEGETPTSEAPMPLEMMRRSEINKLVAKSNKGINILSASVEGKTLNLNVRYSGGCKDHKFRLLWDGSMAKSYPAQLFLNLVDKTTDDSCEALITKTVKVDLSSLQRGEMVLKIRGPRNGTQVRYSARQAS